MVRSIHKHKTPVPGRVGLPVEAGPARGGEAVWFPSSLLCAWNGASASRGDAEARSMVSEGRGAHL